MSLKSPQLVRVPTASFPATSKGAARFSWKQGWKPPSQGCSTHHHVLPAEDDPKGEQHGIEDALSNVSEEQHPSPVKSDGKPLHGDVDERHGNSQSEDDPGEAQMPSLSSVQGRTEPQKPKLCVERNRRKSSTVWEVSPPATKPPRTELLRAALFSPKKKREAVEVSSSQCAWVEGEDGEETIPISQPWALPGSNDQLTWATTGPYSLLQQDGSTGH